MPPTDPDRRAAQIARINELSGLARTAWFSLLGYLVFVGITLLGVKDADFFVPSRQTELPLVGVQIPTASFFWIAPVLGAALYTYLHLFLIKLWDAHADTRTTDSDATHHWLVNDFVLYRQGDPVVRARPLAFLADWITRLLVWGAGPIVLGYAWWRSMPAHDEWMTLLIGACFWVTLVVGFTSWWRAEDRLRQRWTGDWTSRLRRAAAGLVAVLLFAVSWLRTEGGMDNYVDGAWTLADVSFTVPADTSVVRWFADDGLLLPLARTSLAGGRLVAIPDDWRSHDVAEAAFRETWCRREGLAMHVCGQPPSPGHEMGPSVTAARTAWCAEGDRLAADDCAAHFAGLDARFATAWSTERDAALAGLPRLDLRGRDLRRADAAEAILVDAVLFRAQMEGADLRSAQMEGAILSGARMEGADLREAHMERAFLSGALMEGAVLRGALIEGAILSGARMEGADLRGAHMEGAVLRGAHMEGAVLRGAHMEGAVLRRTNLRRSEWAGAPNRASPAHSADLRDAQGLAQAQLEELIGNRETLLPETSPDAPQGPYVWSCWEAEPPDFETLTATLYRLNDVSTASDLRSSFLCGRDPRHKTGMPWPTDAPRPAGHPLGPGD